MSWPTSELASRAVRNLRDLLDSPQLYRLWQAPFARQKLRPVFEASELTSAQSVLDVGCGPGTNATVFSGVPRYVGIDLNEGYIDYARRKYRREFRVADVTKGVGDGERFDLVLMNSLMHHIDDTGAKALLDSLPGVMTDGGVGHILDLVLPPRGLQRRMALLDRGHHPRTPEAWAELVGGSIRIDHMCQYDLGLGPLGLWKMIHFAVA